MVLDYRPAVLPANTDTLKGFYLEAPAISNVEYDFYSTQKYSLICFSLGRVLLQNSSIKLEGTDTIYGIL